MHTIGEHRSRLINLLVRPAPSLMTRCCQHRGAATNYARSRYGPTLHERRDGDGERPSRYDTGGWPPPGVTMAYNGTGRPELR